MITLEQFNKIGKKMLQEPSLFQKAIKYKSEIQANIIPLLTPKETSDIVLSVKNHDVIDKLIKLAAKYYQEEKDDITLCCLGLSLATILQNYGWTNSISGESYKLATKIYEYVSTNGL